MLNMGWEYPAQLLQGADPVLTARHQAGREYTNEQPNNAVSTLLPLKAYTFHVYLLYVCLMHSLAVLAYCFASDLSPQPQTWQN